jgi:CubicO group peptidase (beta-lactamase class C family)
VSLTPLPKQPAGVAWPTDGWPTGELPAKLAATPFMRLVDEAFSAPSTPALGESHALVVVQGGRLIYERYNDGYTPDMTYRSWSMAKSMTHALVGMLVGDGRMDVNAPPDAPEWRTPGDPRGAITLDQLLRMSSGLDWVEEYLPDRPSDVREMLFFGGKADVAGYAAAKPLAHAPGSFFQYASGTTNIVVRATAQAAGLADAAAYHAFMGERLFDVLGMASAQPKFDDAGTFVGSSFCFCTARDFAKFGLLYLRDGVWDGRRLLPEGWVDYARTPTFQQPGAADDAYGAHWWIDVGGPGTFSANGYDGQIILCVPDQDLILVRHGASEVEKDALKAWYRDIVGCFRS